MEYRQGITGASVCFGISLCLSRGDNGLWHLASSAILERRSLLVQLWVSLVYPPSATALFRNYFCLVFPSWKATLQCTKQCSYLHSSWCSPGNNSCIFPLCMGQTSRKFSTYSEYDAYFYFTYSNFFLFFCVSWLLYIKQQLSETATSWQREIRIHWINPWWNKMLSFLSCLLKMVFSELDSKMVSIKLTTDEEKLRGEVKNWGRIFLVGLADSKLNGKSGKFLFLTACDEGKHSCSSTLKVMVKKRMKANPTRTGKVNEEKQE